MSQSRRYDLIAINYFDMGVSMETEIIGMLETAAITVSGFLIKKYVFLEPDMEAEKQRAFYLLSLLVIGAAFFFIWKGCRNNGSHPYD